MDASWTEIEIENCPPLKPEEESMIEMHSLINIFSVLHGELVLLGLVLANNDSYLEEGLTEVEQMVDALRHPDRSRPALRGLAAFRSRIDSQVAAALDRHPDSRHLPEVRDSLNNMEAVMIILTKRVDEILSRDDWNRWERIPVERLYSNFMEVFEAMEKHSRGRYRIIYNLAQQEARDYYVRLDLSTADNSRTLLVPSVIIDVLRDLLANSRKYTPLGGKISAGLFESATSVRLVVEDTGRGIPTEEITKVVEFGRRGSNVGDVRTLGGGFGLTKALRVTKSLGGRLWIASRLGSGTRVRLEVPRPPV